MDRAIDQPPHDSSGTAVWLPGNWDAFQAYSETKLRLNQPFDQTTSMLDRMARAASLENIPWRLDAGKIMADISAEELSLNDEKPVPWELLTAIGTAAAIALIILSFAHSAWNELHSPFIDLARYMEMII